MVRNSSRKNIHIFVSFFFIGANESESLETKLTFLHQKNARYTLILSYIYVCFAPINKLRILLVCTYAQQTEKNKLYHALNTPTHNEGDHTSLEWNGDA